MKTPSPKKAKANPPESTVAATEKTKVVLPPTFTARINQMAHRIGKQYADMWRISTMEKLQLMADNGASLDEISTVLISIMTEPANPAQGCGASRV
jgi:hypothetical protein